MKNLRRYTLPKCPMCGKSSLASHLHCKRTTPKATLWIDIETGSIVCDSCDYKRDLTSSRNLCSCGAIYKGGYLYKEMSFEYEKLMNYEWFRALEINKGCIKPQFIQWAFPFPEYEACLGYKVRYGLGYKWFKTFNEAIAYAKSIYAII